MNLNGFLPFTAKKVTFVSNFIICEDCKFDNSWGPFPVEGIYERITIDLHQGVMYSGTKWCSIKLGCTDATGPK